MYIKQVKKLWAIQQCYQTPSPYTQTHTVERAASRHYRRVNKRGKHKPLKLKKKQVHPNRRKDFPHIDSSPITKNNNIKSFFFFFFTPFTWLIKGSSSPGFNILNIVVFFFFRDFLYRDINGTFCQQATASTPGRSKRKERKCISSYFIQCINRMVAQKIKSKGSINMYIKTNSRLDRAISPLLGCHQRK